MSTTTTGNGIWDYLPAYNTFFILTAKVYIAAIILTVLGYLAYLAYQRYLPSAARVSLSSQAQIAEPVNNKQPEQKITHKVVYVLWTGDMASTYTIITTLIMDASVIVQPVYIPRDVSPTWTKLEKLCMTDLRKLIIKRLPTARTRLLPIMNISPDLNDKAFTDVFQPKFAKLPLAVQPYYPLVQWAYYYKIRDPILVAGFPGSVADMDIVNKTTIDARLVDPASGNPFLAKTILSMARDPGATVPFADILHKTCTCWKPGKARCGDCKGCLVIKAIQKRLIK